VELDGIEPTT